MTTKARVTLSNGRIFEGEHIGAPVSASGELVFTTGMVGYSEALSDPSYYGQILIFSYPLIGNYGIPHMIDATTGMLSRGFESDRIRVAGVIISELCRDAFHWSSDCNLNDWLAKAGVPAVCGVDTRRLVQEIRSASGLQCRISPSSLPSTSEPAFFNPADQNVLPKVSRGDRLIIGKGKNRIGLLDCGVKWNIVRQLVALDCQVEILPWDTDLTTVDCDAWVLSNGPGDPAQTGNLKDRVAGLLKEDRPILGICLGHQILALASGARTTRLPYGHRSHNQPVVDTLTHKGFLTSQNHGYVVIDDSLGADWKVWFKNANDGSIEGIYHREKPFKSVQFHPEAAGGPRDTAWIMEEFIRGIR